MTVAITFCDQPEQERRENKQDHSYFGWSEAEFFSQFIEIPKRFQQSRKFWDLIMDVTFMSRSNYNGLVVMPDVRVIKARL